MNIEDFMIKNKSIGLSMHLRNHGQSPYEKGEIGGHTQLYTEFQIEKYLDGFKKFPIPENIVTIFDKLEFDWEFFEIDRWDNLSRKDFFTLAKYFDGSVRNFDTFFPKEFSQCFMIYMNPLTLDYWEVVDEI